MTKSNKTYDAILIPTGETSFGDRTFPVRTKAVELFNTGKYGCIFVTGGYNGFAKYGPRKEISEAKDTFNFLTGTCGIPEDKIYTDDRSLESVGNLTFPLVMPIYGNPCLDEFKKIMIVGKEGHLWRVKQYTHIVLPPKINLEFEEIPGKHNNGLAAKAYHAGIRNALANKRGPEDIHYFLMHEHPFYSENWFETPVFSRKMEMGSVALRWLLGR